ncbi:hypothetical protein R1sor_025270 [Riccia sorocarpa]|uniref:Uncharacterized protein n=1 Tax=Riccia sorocarpa TaxID=122646 RepID=A0ABD3GAX5_9MARC
MAQGGYMSPKFCLGSAFLGIVCFLLFLLAFCEAAFCCSGILLPSIFHPRNNSCCSELHAKSVLNVERAVARSEEEIRQFCLKQQEFGPRKALNGGATEVDFDCGVNLVRLAVSLTSLPVRISNF